MPRVVVLGAGVCGLAAGLMLARDGHEVTVLERDPAPVPESLGEAWESWARPGVAQFHQAHFMQARARLVLDTELPDVRDALVAAGARRMNPLHELMPPSIADRRPRPGDHRFETLAVRRAVLEQVLGRAADSEPGLRVFRGVAVAGLESHERNGVPQVTGVATTSGRTVPSDLVLDAMGRRSPSSAWLRDRGSGPVPEETANGGFSYYTRYFRAPDGRVPEARASWHSVIGSFSILTLPADAGMWSITLCVAARDRLLKRLRFPDRWEALVRACPRHAHWLEGEPVGGILPMGGLVDRRRSFVRNGRPLATGIAPVADAWACTNPSLGRGIAFGLAQVARLRDTLREQPDDARRFALAWDRTTDEEFTPWYRATVAFDRGRLTEIDALRAGAPAPLPAGPEAELDAALPAAMMRDPDMFRAGLEISHCLTLPKQVFARPGFAARVMDLGAPAGAGRVRRPSRDELLELVA
jgi:2-polyprenyl-6-methoxyphenol hydroxylase-like FAD-dependent oxidoreductase